MDTTQLILDTATRIFSDHVDKPMLDAAEVGSFPEALWKVVVENGFHQLGSEGSGTEVVDLFAFLKTPRSYETVRSVSLLLTEGREEWSIARPFKVGSAEGARDLYVLAVGGTKYFSIVLF